MKVRIARIAKRMHNKFRGLYWRQMFVTVGMVLLTLFLLGVSFFSLSYNYARGQENGELAAQAQVVGQLSASYLENGRYLDMEELQHEEDFQRLASFAATVNDLQSLPDDNESRRFLCFEATRIDYQSPVRHADIYAQALALFRRGEKYWFSGEDIRKINENNETFRQRSPEEELFFTYFRKPERFDTPQYLTASDIMTKLSVFTRITPTRSNIVTLSKVLKKHGFKLTKTRGKLLFEVAEITSEQVKANFLRPRQEEEDRAQKENDIFKGQEDKPE
mgnify:CR=1 FL=1